MCRSTCFERPRAHHQELTTALTASGFTFERRGSSVVGHGLTGYICVAQHVSGASAPIISSSQLL